MSNIRDMTGMFMHCFNLKEINIRNIDAQKLECIAFLFDSCKRMESVNMDLNASKIKNMSSVFSGCKRLTSVNFGQINTTEVISMRAMFAGCTAIQNLDLTEFNTKNTIDMTHMFAGCKSLKTLVMRPTANEDTDTSGMFLGCSRDLEITLV